MALDAASRFPSMWRRSHQRNDHGVWGMLGYPCMESRGCTFPLRPAVISSTNLLIQMISMKTPLSRFQKFTPVTRETTKCNARKHNGGSTGARFGAILPAAEACSCLLTLKLRHADFHCGLMAGCDMSPPDAMPRLRIHTVPTESSHRSPLGGRRGRRGGQTLRSRMGTQGQFQKPCSASSALSS